MTAIQIGIAGAVLLVAVGLYGLLVSRHLIKVVIALQIMVKGAMLAIIVAVPTSNTCRICGALPARKAAIAAVIDSS